MSQYNSDELKIKLKALFNNKEYEALFKGDKQILNEQGIIVNETTTLIPDKIILKSAETIIIDYKTGKPKNEDRQQIEHRLTLEAMEYPNVRGYLFYTTLNELYMYNKKALTIAKAFYKLDFFYENKSCNVVYNFRNCNLQVWFNFHCPFNGENSAFISCPTSSGDSVVDIPK